MLCCDDMYLLAHEASSKVKFSAWSTSWRPPGTDWPSPRWPKWTLLYDFAVRDSTINNVPVLWLLISFVYIWYICITDKYFTSAFYLMSWVHWGNYIGRILFSYEIMMPCLTLLLAHLWCVHAAVQVRLLLGLPRGLEETQHGHWRLLQV